MTGRRIGLAIVTLALLLPCSAKAADAGSSGSSGSSDKSDQGRLLLHTQTVFLPQERAYGGPIEGWPVYQWLELTGYDLATPGLSLHTSVWGSGVLAGGGDPVTGKPLAGDVNLLYLQYRGKNGHVLARVGRQLVMTGPGAGYFGQVDGGFVRLAWSGFDLEAYGGQPARTRFQNYFQYDWLVGARVGYRRWGRVNVGLSWLEARTGGVLARSSVGLDLAVDLSTHVDVVGDAAWDLVGNGLMEAKLMARVRPVKRLTIGITAEQASPGRLIDQSSIFSVFTVSDYADAGILAEYAVTPQWVLGAHYARVFFPSAKGTGFGPGGDRFGFLVRARPVRHVWTSATVDRMPATDNGYLSVRLTGRWQPPGKLSCSLDLLGWFYDHPPLSDPRAGSQSLAAQLFGEYQIHHGLYLGLGGQLGETVVSAFDASAIVRLVADFDTGGAK